MSNSPYPDIVARCDTCRRGFVLVNRHCEEGGHTPCPYTGCTGRVVMMPTPEPSPYGRPNAAD